MNLKRDRYSLLCFLSAAALVVLFIASLSVGRFSVPPGTVLRILASPVSFAQEKPWTGLEESVILNIRFPRVLLALVSGMGLGICGAVFQGVFRNPLVSPGGVGVTSGAGFGAALAILLFGWGPMTQVFAFLFGMGALVLTWTITKKTRGSSLLVFVLAGVIINMFFQALISLVKFLADSQEKLPGIVYWLMGSLSASSWDKAAATVPIVLAGTLVLLLLRWRINLLSLGEETVVSLGVSPVALINIVLCVTSLIVSAIVSVAGVVGWVGLIVPHIARMVVGPDHDRLLPISVLFGGTFFMAVDTLGRTLSPMDIPLGILTAVVGAPVFIALLVKSKGEWNL